MSLCATCGRDAGEVARFCPSCGAPVVRATGGDPMVGRIVAGKFRVEALLGEGGMGMVYKATQINLDKTIVLKVLRPALNSDERTVQRFQREARAASRLNHPNSIQVIDFGQSEDGALYIAMEYCSGRDLHHILGHEWPLEERRMVRIISQVLGALVEAHAHGVIHRDLKPENIMVEQRRGEPDFVKVLDFGIAKIQDSTGEEGQALTRAGFVCGTPEYMSPEQAKGTTVDHRSDLYAVGVILYQLVTGMLPFDSESAVGFATAHLTQEVPPIRKRRPEARCSPGMERLIMRALSKDPNLRPQSAEAFRAELVALAPAAASGATAGAPYARPGTAERTEVTQNAWNDRTPAEPSSTGEATTPLRMPLKRDADATQAMARPPRARTQVTSGASRAAVGITALGLLGAGGFFVWEYFLKKPDPVPLVEPVTTRTLPATTEPAPPASHGPTPAVGTTGVGASRPLPVEPVSSSAGSGEELSLTKMPASAEAQQRARESLKMAREQLRQGHAAEALSAAEAAYRDDPNNPSVVKQYADLLSFGARREQHQQAVDLYKKLLERRDLAETERHMITARLKAIGDVR